MGMTMPTDSTTGLTYQERLRAIGAWLDVRGLRDVRIIEEAGTLRIEAAGSPAGELTALDAMTFDRPQLDRLCAAAKRDRGSTPSKPQG